MSFIFWENTSFLVCHKLVEGKRNAVSYALIKANTQTPARSCDGAIERAVNFVIPLGLFRTNVFNTKSGTTSFQKSLRLSNRPSLFLGRSPAKMFSITDMLGMS